MKIGGEYTFDGPQALVWAMLLDPVVLAQVLPGAEKLERTGENEFEGALRMKIGPIQGNFQGKVHLREIDPPNGYTMQVDGRGAPGFVKATGHLKLAARGETTHMTYDGDAQVGGKLAAVGQRLIESSTRAIIAQSLEGLNGAVKARVAAGESRVAPDGATEASGDARAASGDAESNASVSPPVMEKPTQSEFAAGVARQVAADLIPPAARKAIAVVAVLVVLLLVWIVLT